MRTIQKIKCEICGEEYSSAGFGNHVKITHNLSIDDYVTKHGEYRINNLKSTKILEESNKQFKCVLDTDDKLYTERSLTFHLRKIHNLTKEQYVVEHLNSGKIPVCKCGCGTPTKILSYDFPYAREYITGHNSFGKNNPMSKGHSEDSKNKMRKSAIKRIKKHNGTLPYHSKQSIKKRSKHYSSTMLKRRVETNNVTLTSTDDELIKKIFKFKCNKCGSSQIDHGFSFFVCEKCFPKVRSRYELELKEFFDSINIEYLNNCRKIVDNRFELDFYFPEKKLALEFNGLYYHGELSNNKNKEYHLLKTDFCKEKDISLIHIFEDEWVNKKDIVKSKLLYLLNVPSSNKVFARNCKIKEISFNESCKFLDENHIQGKDKSKIRLGLFNENELVSVMTFSRVNVSKGYKSSENIYELSRFCSKKYYSVIGGYSKLFSFFKKTYDFDKAITYADRRWSSKNNVYSKLGWEYIGITPPNYWYMDKQHTQRKHRFNFTKHIIVEKMNGDPTLTEWENMKKMGFDRIWDCGHFKYEYKKRDTN